MLFLWESQADRCCNSLDDYSPTPVCPGKWYLKTKNGSVSCLLQHPLIPCPFSCLTQSQFCSGILLPHLAKNYRVGLLGLWVPLSPLPGRNQKWASGPILASGTKRAVCWMGWGRSNKIIFLHPKWKPQEEMVSYLALEVVLNLWLLELLYPNCYQPEDGANSEGSVAQGKHCGAAESKKAHFFIGWASISWDFWDLHLKASSLLHLTLFSS